jgi:hypothetical protein
MARRTSEGAEIIRKIGLDPIRSCPFVSPELVQLYRSGLSE